ncbi:ABC transporter permease [Bartonella sp. LJL80]
MKTVLRHASGLLGLLVLLLLWWLATDLLVAPQSFAHRFSVSQTLPTLWHLMTQSDLPFHAFISLKRILIGLALALIIGVPIGLLIGAKPWAERSTGPAFQFLRMISPLSWMPIAVMVFGVGDNPIYFLLTFATIWPIMINTAAGVKQLDRHWLLIAKSLAATKTEKLFHIVFPGIFGHIITGIRLAIGIAWIVIVPCEMLGVSAGLGYFILDTRDRLAYPELMATILVIGAIGYFLDAFIRYIARKL